MPSFNSASRPTYSSSNADDLIAQIDYSTAPSQTPSYTSMPMAGGDGAGGGMDPVDGKEFFKRARNRLSFQQFNEFLANIKRLNSHVQNREDTLQKARDIFGQENEDLHVAFTALLSRHGA